jgi:2-dehydro-3-deoxy-D-arabinonate dehydratase
VGTRRRHAEADDPGRRAARRPRRGRGGGRRRRAEGAPLSRLLVRFAGDGGRPRAGLVEGERVRELPGDDLLPLLDGDLPDPVADHELERLRLLRPLDPPEVWCAGVTYERSRTARMEESEVRDVYALVYDAERPELFLKDAGCRRTVGPGEPIGVRSDATWSVPEPELGVVLGPGGRLLAATAGNDVSSRDIEGANPLYLPQAKVYAGACALGPAVLVPDDWDEPFEIGVTIRGSDGEPVFEDATSTARMRRSFAELAAFCVRDNPVPRGSVLLTGTGIVPPDAFTLEPGQTVEVRVGRIGVLRNPVVLATELLGEEER